MFGYVKPFKPQMRICEYETYKAVYCGLCKQLGQEYGPLSRFTLSYDFAFLALLEFSLSEQGAPLVHGRCMLNPLRKISCCHSCDSLSFSCGAAMIMLYYKAMDNYNDGGLAQKMLSMLYLPFARKAYKRAADRYPQVAQIIYEAISQQSAIETKRSESVDEACEPTAMALSGLCALIAKDDRQGRILERFGYLLGRYIYLADALDDLEEDLKQGSYNAFLLREHLESVQQVSSQQLALIRENAKGTLFLTIGEIIKTYELLELQSYQPILDNIIHLGLRETVERILLPKEAKYR